MNAFERGFYKALREFRNLEEERIKELMKDIEADIILQMIKRKPRRHIDFLFGLKEGLKALLYRKKVKKCQEE